MPVAVSDMAVATVAGVTYLLGGEDNSGTPSRRSPSPASPSKPGTWVAGADPFNGHLLIADRGNDRLLLVDTSQVGRPGASPQPTAPAPAVGFYFPDDAFFAKHGTAIITNQEDQNTIIELAYPSGAVIASYGHPNRPGSAPGYLDQPDDAYLLGRRAGHRGRRHELQAGLPQPRLYLPRRDRHRPPLRP